MLDPQIQDNIKWHQVGAPFYNVLSMVFNPREQHYLEQQIIKLSKQIDTTLPVLDFGSGTGNVVKYLEKTGLETVAMDVSLEMLKQNPARNRIVAESQYLPFKDSCFGMITAYGVFHHLPKPLRALEEICRVAAPHCIIFIPHEPIAGLKPTLLSKLVDWSLWILWRLTHPKALGRLVSYILFHRKRLKKLEANLHYEHDLDPDTVQAICKIMAKYGFEVETTYFGRIIRLKGYR